jgi:CDGSH-type Zn-finger protein
MSILPMGPRRDQAVQIEPCPDGPVLVRGAEVVLDADGEEHEVTRPVVALCTCGRTQSKPFCDGTHKFVRG